VCGISELTSRIVDEFCVTIDWLPLEHNERDHPRISGRVAEMLRISIFTITCSAFE